MILIRRYSGLANQVKLCESLIYPERPDANQDMLTDYHRISGWGLKFSVNVAIISFFLLFPGFLFYHQFTAMGLIPSFAAGLFGYVSLGALLVFLVLLPWNTDWLKKVIRNRYVQLVLVFLCFTSVWTLAHYIILNEDYITKASLQSLQTVIFWSCLFLIGLLLPLESNSLRWSFLISFVAILCFLLYYHISTGSDMYNAHRLYGKTADVSTYQGFARSVLITLLLLITVFNSWGSRACFILGGVFILFLLISRSDFYAFLALSVVLCVISGIKQPKYLLLLLLLSLEVFMLAEPDISPRIGVFVESFSRAEVVQAPSTDSPSSPDEIAQPPSTDNLSSSDEIAQAPIPEQTDIHVSPDTAAKPARLRRQFEVLDFSSSKSWAGRLALQRIALGQIAENPLTGKFGGHVLTEDTGKYAKGHTGRYAHNALSAWVSYGIPGFLMYVSLTLIGFLVPAYHIILKQQDTQLWTFAFMINFVCLLLIIVSKPVYWPLPALGWGVLAQALINPSTDRS